MRPSELLGIDDDYTAYCLDEVCLFMVQQAREKREPDFNRPAKLEKRKQDKNRTTNADARDMLMLLGARIG